MSSETPIQVLLIEDEEFDVRRVRRTIKPFEQRIHIAAVVPNGRMALDLIRERDGAFDVVIMDFQIAGGLMGENLIRELKRTDESLQIIVITKMTVNVMDFEFANSLVMAGAFWYCTKYPGDIEEYIYQPTDFVLSVFNAYNKRVLEREQHKTKRKLLRTIEESLGQKRIIGTSPSVANLRHQIERCAESDVSVLISGASGTGKELVAHNIHYRSRRRLENFIPINCGSIPADLVESELFGYEKGAFTGANAAKPGLFEVANHGTLFLDEVSELPPAAQVKLLRVIQEGEIEKIGRTEPLKVDIRIIAATNKNLEHEVAERRFREDLYYRLNVVPVSVPPLRERSEDIPLLTEHFLREFAADMGKVLPEVTPEAMSVLTFAPWKGNVRELKNVVQRLLFMNEPVITREIVQFALGLSAESSGGASGAAFEFTTSERDLPLRQLERIVRQKYVEHVRAESGSDAEAAKKLGLAPSNYHRMCKELGIK
ncbi:MAG: sigma-54-dependent Fis family transcriptional regulator [Bacteroidetes bacterium]|nr:MAG: sigma-54-dependent Fis family transcriptional regulator [Bacteroidota bacterium]